MLEELQQHELLLTAAQSIFAVAVLVNLRLSRSEGVLLLVLFLTQLIVASIRLEVMVAYLALAVVYHIAYRKHLWPTAVTGLGFRRLTR